MTKLGENEVRIVDALFQEMAERNNRGLSAAHVIDGSWLLFERGCLRLVDDGKHMGIEPCDGNRAERRAQAKQNRPLVELKRQMDRARENAL
jgi:hypothetical protein